MFKLPKLKYNYDALEPFFDAKTMEIHHSKHHQAYVDNLNAAWAEFSAIAPSFTELSLREFLNPENEEKARDFLTNLNGNGYELLGKIQNNGGGHLNHSLFWSILRPAGEGENLPPAEFLAIIEKYFYSFDNFKASFKQEALGRFGSGWAWLRTNRSGELEIGSTANQDYYDYVNMGEPILGLDVWEHAYYLNYQNRRADFVDAFWNLVDWDAVFKNYQKAVSNKNSDIVDDDFEEGKCDIIGCEEKDNPFPEEDDEQ